MGDDASLIETGGEGDHAVARNTAIGRFDAGQTGQRGWLTNRATGIGRGGGRRQPRGNGGDRTTGTAAGYPLQIPGIAHRAVPGRFIGRAHREFVHVALAEHHRPAFDMQLAHDGGVVRGDEAVQHLRGAGGAHPAGTENILLREGDAGQRAGIAGGQARIRRVSRRQRLLGGDGDEAVELSIVRFDAPEKVGGQLAARKGLRAQAVGHLLNCEFVHIFGMGSARGAAQRCIHLQPDARRLRSSLIQ